MLPLITIYTSETCAPCKRVKEMLDNAGVDYIQYNITKDTEARDFIVGKGFRSVPITVAGNLVIQGYDPEKIQKLIDQRV